MERKIYFRMTFKDLSRVYFGPFEVEEAQERIDDAYADALDTHGELESVFMDQEEAKKYYVFSKEFWMRKLKEITDNA